MERGSCICNGKILHKWRDFHGFSMFDYRVTIQPLSQPRQTCASVADPACPSCEHIPSGSKNPWGWPPPPPRPPNSPWRMQRHLAATSRKPVGWAVASHPLRSVHGDASPCSARSCGPRSIALDTAGFPRSILISQALWENHQGLQEKNRIWSTLIYPKVHIQYFFHTSPLILTKHHQKPSCCTDPDRTIYAFSTGSFSLKRSCPPITDTKCMASASISRVISVKCSPEKHQGRSDWPNTAIQRRETILQNQQNGGVCVVLNKIKK